MERNFEVHTFDTSCHQKFYEMLFAHAKALAKITAKYPLTHIEMKSIYTAVYTAKWQCDTRCDIQNSDIQKRLIIDFVDNRAKIQRKSYA